MESLEKIWDYQFHHELKVDPAEHPILLTEIGDAYKSQREKMIQLMFETFNVPYFYIECQSVLSMISSGSLTGFSFESGEGCSYAIPVYDGYKIPHAIKKSKVAGKVLNEWLNHLLREDGKYFDSSSEKEIIRDIKEEACYVSLDYKKEIKTIDSYYYKLPDENYISFREERIKCTELLFNPDLYKREDDGIQKIVYDSINSCDINIRQDLFKRIVISGGTTLFKGFIERLESEIKNFREKVSFGYNRVNVIRPIDVSQYCTWFGGSIWTSIARLDEHYISHEEYNDNGPGIVHVKCL